MNDKSYLETLLTNTKSCCDLLLHGTIESSTPEVHAAFNNTLFTTLEIQNALYKQMEAKGWYQTKPVPVTKIQQTATQVTSGA